jgi:carbon storage regulator
MQKSHANLAGQGQDHHEGTEVAMLVLSRKVGAKIVIDERITLTVVRIEGGQVRLGIEAPREVPIQREELVTGGRPGRDLGFESDAARPAVAEAVVCF